MKFPDEDVDDPDEEEDVQEDGADARDLVDPVVRNVVHPAAENNQKVCWPRKSE